MMASSTSAFAYSDDPGADPPGGINAPSPVGHRDVGAPNGPSGSCDTLDPIKDQNDLFVWYTCIPEADIQDVNVTTGGGFINVDIQTLAVIPTSPVDVATDVPVQLQGVSFYVIFQNPAKQNARQASGFTTDCNRFAHRGPFLDGNSEYLYASVSIALDVDPNNPTQLVPPTWSFGHFDPIGNIFYSMALAGAGSGAPSNTAEYCSAPGAGGRRTPSVSPASGFLASMPQPSVVNSGTGSKVTLRIPYHAHWLSGTGVKNQNDYDIASAGDVLNNIAVVSYGDVGNFTPAIQNPVDHTELVGRQGIKFLFTLDWAPFRSYSQGIFTPQTSALSGPTCPSFSLIETSVETYTTGLSGTTGKDEAIQVNPLFSPTPTAANGLSHYDSSNVLGKSDSTLVVQDHKGTRTCDVSISTASQFRPSGISASVA